MEASCVANENKNPFHQVKVGQKGVRAVLAYVQHYVSVLGRNVVEKYTPYFDVGYKLFSNGIFIFIVMHSASGPM